MRHSFSAEFLRVLPPDTSFGDAWESLCFDLLTAEGTSPPGLGPVRLAPPDRGVDILNRATGAAYQCKASERGALGTLGADESVKSLRSAASNRLQLEWKSFSFATNALYSGAAIQKILAVARSHRVRKHDLRFLGPEHWDALCTRHFEKVRERFNYRVSADEQTLLAALRQAARADASQPPGIERATQRFLLTNSLTPLEIDLPLAANLRVSDYLEIARALLGLAPQARRTIHGMVVNVSVTITRSGKEQVPDKTLGDLAIAPGERLHVRVVIAEANPDQLDWPYSREPSSGRGGMARPVYRATHDEVLEDTKRVRERVRRQLEDGVWSGATLLRTGSVP